MRGVVIGLILLCAPASASEVIVSSREHDVILTPDQLRAMGMTQRTENGRTYWVHTEPCESSKPLLLSGGS